MNVFGRLHQSFPGLLQPWIMTLQDVAEGSKRQCESILFEDGFRVVRVFDGDDPSSNRGNEQPGGGHSSAGTEAIRCFALESAFFVGCYEPSESVGENKTRRLAS